MFIQTMIVQHQAQPTICSHFGCGCHLSPAEALFSDRCYFHQPGAGTIGRKTKKEARP